jgi:class III poly(R)-hydroxyalkanoic acid synthase PhaE subunit
MMVESGNSDNVQAFILEQMNRMFDFWSNNLKMPTIGPTYAFSKEFSSYFADFIYLGKVMVEHQANMDSYWSLMSEAFRKAMNDTIDQAPNRLDTKEDMEGYRRAVIEAFEDAFTNLFTSSDFSEVYGKLFSSQLNLSKATQSILEKNLKMLNLPTRTEIDDVLKEIAELKRTVRDLKRSVELKNDQARFTT